MCDRHLLRSLVIAAALVRAPSGWAEAGNLPAPAVRKIDFAAELQPLFTERCLACHGPKKQESALRVDGRDYLLKGGDNGPAIVPGKSAESILVQVLAGTHPDLARMPKKKEKLTAEHLLSPSGQ